MQPAGTSGTAVAGRFRSTLPHRSARRRSRRPCGSPRSAPESRSSLRRGDGSCSTNPDGGAAGLDPLPLILVSAAAALGLAGSSLAGHASARGGLLFAGIDWLHLLAV